MECPYCKAEMEQGVIQSPHELFWEKKTHILGRAKFHKGSTLLSAYSMVGSTVIAYQCDACKKIVIDYENGACDYNKRNRT